MSDLKAFTDEVRKISGVKDVTRHHHGGNPESFVQVSFHGEPADYKSQISTLKDQYNIKQIDRPSRNYRDKTADKMPILYFAPR